MLINDNFNIPGLGSLGMYFFLGVPLCAVSTFHFLTAYRVRLSATNVLLAVRAFRFHPSRTFLQKQINSAPRNDVRFINFQRSILN